MIKIKIAAALIVACCTSTLSVDLTLESNAKGADVVLATVARIRESGLFSDDCSFMRRIAYVETRDGELGTDNGGIWSVSFDQFNATKQSIGQDFVNSINAGIRWDILPFSETNRPLWSALAARISIENRGIPIPTCSDIAGQAQFWATHYNTDGNVTTFINDVQDLEQEEVCMVKSDIIFVLDSSGSIGSLNFEEVRNFTTNYINELVIGPDNTQVGIIVYASTARTLLHLNSSSSREGILEEFNQYQYRRGSTNTADGLCLMLEGFEERNGARVSQSDVFRLGIVLTDGRSNRNSQNCPPPGSTTSVAQMVRNSPNPITVFSIGVTNNVDLGELRDIASRDDFAVIISNFDSLLFRQLSDQQMDELCNRITIPIEMGVQTGTPELGGMVRYELQVPEEGVTIQLCVRIGSIIFYASYSIPNPNEAFHDFRIEVISMNETLCSDVFIPPENNTNSGTIFKRQVMEEVNTTLFVALVGAADQNEFFLNASQGDNTLVHIAPVGNVTIFPKEACVGDGKEVSFLCSVDQGDDITYSWTEASSGVTLSSSGEFLNVTATNEIMYKCTVRNSVSSGCSNATLYVAPRLMKEPEDNTLTTGERVELRCQFKGQTTITWSHNSKEIGQNKRVCISESNTEDGILSTLIIERVQLSDCGHYSCIGITGVCNPVIGTAVLKVQATEKFDAVPVWLWPLFRGQNGQDGYNGEKGKMGMQGKQGNTGSPGEMGNDPGVKGSRGSVGNQGKLGLNGAKGRVGDKGDPGDRGDIGLNSVAGGAVYIAWGLSKCPQINTTQPLLEGGFMSVSPRATLGSGTNYLCLPSTPSFSDSANPNAFTQSRIVGVIYSTIDEPLRANHGRAVPCSVCFTSRPVKLMIPGRAVCPGSKWRLEYNGYLMSSRDTPSSPLSVDEGESFRFRTEYVCVSSDTVGVAVDGSQSDNDLYHVHFDCESGASLQCTESVYTTAHQLTCAVCTLNN